MKKIDLYLNDELQPLTLIFIIILGGFNFLIFGLIFGSFVLSQLGIGTYFIGIILFQLYMIAILWFNIIKRTEG